MAEHSPNLLIPAEFYFQATCDIPLNEGMDAAIKKGQHPDFASSLPELAFLPGEKASPLSVRMAWNSRGIGLQIEVTGKKQPARPQTISEPAAGEHFEFFIDTRDMKSVHRASRFCHQFVVIPPALRLKRDQPAAAVEIDLPGVNEKTDLASPDELPTVSSRSKEGYQISCWIPGSVLEGFDPENVPSLGFYYRLHDEEFGTLQFGVGEKFPVSHDPSLWPSVRLVR